MADPLYPHIVQVEDRLRSAMLASDVDALDTLLSEDLLFTNHLGSLQSKHEDLTAHRSGALRITAITPSEQHIHQPSPTVAIVSVRMANEGTYHQQPANGSLRFTRVWALSSTGTWRVAAAHATLIT